MNYNYARFQEPMDERDYDGVCTGSIDLEESLIDGVCFTCNLRASFRYEGLGWTAEEVYLLGFRRIEPNGMVVPGDAPICITDDPRWRGMVEAAVAWADKYLDPKDYCDD